MSTNCRRIGDSLSRARCGRAWQRRSPLAPQWPQASSGNVRGGIQPFQRAGLLSRKGGAVKRCARSSLAKTRARRASESRFDAALALRYNCITGRTVVSGSSSWSSGSVVGSVVTVTTSGNNAPGGYHQR